ncbi:MAG: VWA domain-containing protein [Oscillospiraceae bacterium]|nr:VWA domain-containing protein [Oscillospiraceae bacterium]
MKKGLTELVFILDKSGSMGGLEKDTIGGYNSVLEKQQAAAGECRLTTVLFDNNYELLHDRIDVRAVRPITEKEYFVGGSTALLDAIGITINKIGNAQKNTADDYRAEKVMFVIITDGEENASREFNAENLKAKIEHQKEKYNWEFIFLGANIDAVETARHFGINADRAQNYHADSEGSRVVYESLALAAVSFRETPVYKPLAADWNADIQADFKSRKKKK